MVNDRKDEIIKNLENNIEFFDRQITEKNAKIEALEKEHQEEMRSLEVKIMQEQNEIKGRYEERIRKLEEKIRDI